MVISHPRTNVLRFAYKFPESFHYSLYYKFTLQGFNKGKVHYRLNKRSINGLNLGFYIPIGLYPLKEGGRRKEEGGRRKEEGY